MSGAFLARWRRYATLWYFQSVHHGVLGAEMTGCIPETARIGERIVLGNRMTVADSCKAQGNAG